MSQKQKAPVQLAILFSLIAWASAFYALWHQISLTSGAASESAFCNINAYINCDTVALSSYSMLLGFPLAALAMAFYSIFFIIAVMTYFAEVDKNGERVKNLADWLFVLALGGLPVTVYYAIVSVAVLESLCISCMMIYLVHMVLIILTYKIKKNARWLEPLSRMPFFSFSSGLLFLFAAVIGLNLLAPKVIASSMGNGPQMDESTLSLYVAQHLNNPKHTFSAENAAVVGLETAPVTIVAFSDYQCPYCKLASNVIPAVTRAYGDRVRVIYKDYPLSSECNPGMTHAGHPYACQAAKLTKCALQTSGIDAYKKLSKSIFDHQEKLGTDRIKALALDSGLTESQISGCLTSLAIHDAIVADVAEGTAAGVDSTPSIYVNGRKLESAVNPQILRLTINHYLDKL